VRSGDLAKSMSQYLREEIAATPDIEVHLRSVVVGGGGEGRLESLDVRDLDSGSVDTVPAGALFVLIGASPHTDWLPPSIARDARGYVLTGTDLVREGGAESTARRLPLMFETSVPGVFAVGDARANSVKRVASAVGEGSVVVQHVDQYLSGGV
jgi:thioredoxin reductase (NADPH)